jgi:hypothetical protein
MDPAVVTLTRKAPTKTAGASRRPMNQREKRQAEFARCEIDQQQRGVE